MFTVVDDACETVVRLPVALSGGPIHTVGLAGGGGASAERDEHGYTRDGETAGTSDPVARMWQALTRILPVR
jgi:hypothetical protein